MKKLKLSKVRHLRKRFVALSLPQKTIVLLLVSALVISGAIFAVAELGGYGANGPDTSPNTLDMGLVGYWNFEEGGGQTIYDRSGSGNDGTLGSSSSADSADPVFRGGHDSSGENGVGMGFDGVSDYVDAGTGSSLDITGAITLAGWFKLDDTSATGCLFGQGVGFNTNGNYGYMISYSNEGYLYFDNYSSDTRDYLRFTFGDTDWHYVVGTWNGTADADGKKIYLDGVLAVSGNTTFTAMGSTSYDFMIGKGSSPNVYPFRGAIDEVRVYDRALSEDEIRLLYNQKKPILEMKFDEGSGTVAHDESFNDNDGTISGATWTTGKSGTALSFDGTDDYVDAGDISSADWRGLSTSSWVYWTADGLNGYAGVYYKGNSSDLGRLLIQNNGLLLVQNGNGNFNSTGTVSKNVWTHILYVYDQTAGQEYLYINGKLNGQKARAGNITQNATDMWVGFGYSAATNYMFPGLIDSVRIYNYARTADEVLADYNDGMAARLGGGEYDLGYGLAGYWDMEEASGQVLYDKSGNGNNGTLGYNSSAETQDPVFGLGHDPSGENGTGMVLDGINDLADIDVNAGFSSPTGISMGGWVKPSVASSAFRTGGWNYYSRGYWTSTPYELGHWGNSNPSFKLYNSAGSSFSLSSGQALSGNTWYHLFVTADPTTGAMKFYINGVLKNSNTSFSGSLPGITSMNIGGGSSGCNFPGTIDDFRLYDRALSADEVRLLYNQKKPVLEMKFDEGSGTTAHDESFNDNDGTINGAIWAEGQSGTALSFDGTDDYVSIANDTAFNFGTDDFSASLWTKTSSATFGSIAGNGDASINDGWNIDANADGTMRCRLLDNASYDASTTASYNDGLWHNVSCVRNGDSLYIYIDGILRGSGSGVDSIDVSNTESFKIGARNYGTEEGNMPFAGSVDSVRVYNYARTADEVLADHNDGLSAHLGESGEDLEDGLAGYWDFEEGSGLTAYDKSGNGNNGTLGTSSATELAKPFFATGHDAHGENGMGLGLTGRSEYVSAGTGSSLQLTSAGTIALWVKPNSLDQDDFANFVTRRSNSTGGSPANYSYSFHWRGLEDLIRLAISDGSVLDIATMPLPTDLNWHHMVGTWDGTGLKLYMDGEIAMTPVPKTHDAQAGASFNTALAGYAFSTSAVGRQEFNGTLDEIRVYNRALSDAEIRQLYNEKGPVFEMKFDEGAGTAVYDETLPGYDGTVSGATWVEGKNGTALSFDGTDDYVDVSSASALSLENDYSISMWVYNRAGAKLYPTLLNKRIQSGANGYFWIYTSDTDERDINYQYANGSTTGTASFGEALSLNSWTHLEFTFVDATKSLKLFVDGQQYSTTRTLTGALPVAAGNLYLGTYQGSSTNYPFYGYIDDVRIYDYCRTDAEVLTDYNAGLAAHLR